MKFLGIGSIVLILCALICGIWMKTHPGSDANFHAGLSILTLIVCLITIVTFMAKR